jgi:hypothetical protein
MNKTDRIELATSTVKSLIGAIPYAGTLLNEIAFDYRSRLKQERLNSFTHLLAEFFIENPGTKIEDLRNEEFSDLFDSVLQKISQTKSKEKHKRFRDILTLHIQNQDLGTDNSEIYLDLVSSLNEISINILKEHQQFKKAHDTLKSLMNKLEIQIKDKQHLLNDIYVHNAVEQILNNDSKKEVDQLQNQLGDYKKQEQLLQHFRKAEFYDLLEDEFLYYKQILLSKGLLVDSGVGTLGHIPFLYMGITEFGNKFIEFLLIG